jgi:LmbE family N-acetylglucosaminyl deacetylase
MKQLIKRFILFLWKRVVPKQARNSLRLWLMLEMPDRAPQLIAEFGGGPVVVLAPHMDDEIIGPGGTVIRHLAAGCSVSFVIVTDGGAGDPRAVALSSKQAYVETRKQESRRAAEIVGVKDLVFLDGPDGELTDTPGMIAAMEKIFAERKPGIVYAPAVTDNHRDHWGTNRILRRVLDRLPAAAKRDLVIRGYEVWTPLPANRMVDISGVVEKKRAAIEAFESQTKMVDYSRAILGLNQYRSMRGFFGKGYAEAFLESSCDEFCGMVDRICLKGQ